MRSEYYGSVKVTYFDKEAVWKALRELAADLATDHPEVVKIAVFGSLARDEAVPGSDVDILLILNKTDLLCRTGSTPTGPPVFLSAWKYSRTRRTRRGGCSRKRTPS